MSQKEKACKNRNNFAGLGILLSYSVPQSTHHYFIASKNRPQKDGFHILAIAKDLTLPEEFD